MAVCTRPIVVPISPVGRLVVRDHDHDRYSGALPDLMQEIAARTGCEFVYRDVPRARAQHLVFEEHVGDVYMPALRRAERDATHDYVGLYRDGLAVVTLRGADDVPDRLSELAARSDLRGVFVRGYWLGPRYAAFVDQATAERRAYVVSDAPTIGRMLRAGRAAFTLIPWVGGQDALEAPDRAPDAATEFVLTLLRDVAPQATGIYLSRRNLDEGDRHALLQALEAAIADGTVRRIFSRYYAPEVIERAQWRAE